MNVAALDLLEGRYEYSVVALIHRSVATLRHKSRRAHTPHLNSPFPFLLSFGEAFFGKFLEIYQQRVLSSDKQVGVFSPHRSLDKLL